MQTVLQKHIEYERANKKLRLDLDDLRLRFNGLQSEHGALGAKLHAESTEKETLRNVNTQQKKVIDRYIISYKTNVQYTNITTALTSFRQSHGQSSRPGVAAHTSAEGEPNGQDATARASAVARD